MKHDGHPIIGFTVVPAVNGKGKTALITLNNSISAFDKLTERNDSSQRFENKRNYNEQARQMNAVVSLSTLPTMLESLNTFNNASTAYQHLNKLKSRMKS